MKVNQIKLGVVLSYIVIVLNIIVGVVYTPILTSSLGQSEYGIYSIVSSIISYLTILDFGFGNAIIIYTARYRKKNEKEKEQKLYGMFSIIYIIIGIIAGIIGIILSMNVRKIFGRTMTNEEIAIAKELMNILVINLVFTFSFSIYSSIMTAYERFVFPKIINIIRVIVQPTIMIVLLSMGYKSIALATLLTILNILTLLINYIYCKIKLKIKFKFGKFNIPLLKEISAFSFFVFLNTIIDKVNWNVDQFILGAVSGTVSAAIYAVAVQLINMYISFSTAISSVMLPKATKMEVDNVNNEGFTDIFIKTGRIQFLIIGLIVTGFIIFGKEFIEIIWVGKEYTLSYYITCILMIALSISLIQNMGINILQAKNKYKYRSIMLFIIAIFNVIISIPLAKYFGSVGSACATGFCLILGQGIMLNRYYQKNVGLDIKRFWEEILKMAIPLVVIFIFGIIMNSIFIPKNPITIVVQIIIYTIIYVVFMYVFATNDYEKDLIKTPIEKLLRRNKKNENN